MKLAIYGISGSGKTYVSKMIAEHFGLIRCSTGEICREISMLLFGDDAKSNLNHISEKLRELSDDVWLQAALRNIKEQSVILDSIRYPSDYRHLKELDFKFVLVSASPELADARLTARGQKITQIDKQHASETSLLDFSYDYVIINDASQTDQTLIEQISKISG